MIKNFVAFTVGIFAICVTPLFAESENAETFSAFVLTGYGIPSGGVLIGDTSINAGQTEVKDHYINYGEGLKLAGGVNYRIMPNIFGQLSLDFSWKVPSNTIMDDFNEAPLSIEYKHHYSMFGIKTSIIPKFRIFSLIDIYAGCGIGLFFSFHHMDQTNTNGSVTATLTNEYKNAAAFVWSGLVGADFPLSEEWVLFGEICFEQMSFKSISRKKVKNSSNMSAIEFVNDEYQANDLNDPAPIKYPGSNTALRIGIRRIIF